MNKRLEMLKQMVASGQADAFAHYGLGMEYRRLEDAENALLAFEQLRTVHPNYLPTYLMAAQILIAQGQKEQAQPWLHQGIALAQSVGDGKTLGELEAALDETES